MPCDKELNEWPQSTGVQKRKWPSGWSVKKPYPVCGIATGFKRRGSGVDGHRIEGSCVSVRKSEESMWSCRQEETGVGRASGLNWSLFSEGVMTVSHFQCLLSHT